MRRVLALTLVVISLAGCTSFPARAYYSPPSPRTSVLAPTLYRAAQAAGDDPTRYSFALIRTRRVTAVSDEDAIFYFSEGLADQPPAVVDALVAHEVAHEVLKHVGQRRALSIGVSAGFAILGFVVPGLGLADFIVNPIVVRAFTREQELEADRRAIDILRSMGHVAPRRMLEQALNAAAAINGPQPTGLMAKEPALDDRLAALEPLEPVADLAAKSPKPRPR